MIRDLYAGFVTGRAFNSFEKKEYVKAAKLIEKVLGYRLKGTNVKYLNSVLGRCYLEMGRTRDATGALLESYSRYKADGFRLESDYEKREFRLLHGALVAALTKEGREQEARAISEAPGGTQEHYPHGHGGQ